MAKKSRIYICHTYYHVYVTFLKEMYLKEQGEVEEKATLVLSKMSNDFKQLKQRIDEIEFFDEVIEFDEKPKEFFEELQPYFKNKGNLFFNMFQRIRMTKKWTKLEEKYVNFNPKEYDDIYVFCDGDPIGVYLNQKKIPYHAVEDGLNCIINFDMARFDNRGAFLIKRFFSRQLNLISIANGYSKYCIDVEVNQREGIKYPLKNFVEVPRKPLVERLTKEEQQLLIKVFVANQEEIHGLIQTMPSNEKKILLLSDPISTLEVREKMIRDMIRMFEGEGQVFIKPHPRDILDYATVFGEYPQIDAFVPMEIIAFYKELTFDKVVSIVTEISGITFGKEVICLGPDFLDHYEEPKIHRQNEVI